MRTLCRWALVLVLLALIQPKLVAAPSAEERDFKDAEKSKKVMEALLKMDKIETENLQS